jgi:hypothetical protein
MAKNGGMAKIMAAWRGVSVMAKIIKMAAWKIIESVMDESGAGGEWHQLMWRVAIMAKMASMAGGMANGGENNVENQWRNGMAKMKSGVK